jgi:hypothetical protein
MQCILYKIYFFESFSYELQFDMYFYMHSYLHKSFYSCKKWVLHAISATSHHGQWSMASFNLGIKERHSFSNIYP